MTPAVLLAAAAAGSAAGGSPVARPVILYGGLAVVTLLVVVVALVDRRITRRARAGADPDRAGAGDASPAVRVSCRVPSGPVLGRRCATPEGAKPVVTVDAEGSIVCPRFCTSCGGRLASEHHRFCVTCGHRVG